MSHRRNILQISTADVRGGAENVARNLQREYRARGHRSQMAVGFKITDDPDVFVIPNESERSGWENFWLEASVKLTTNGTRGVRRAARLAGIIGQPGRQFNQWMGIEDFHFAGTKRIVELADKPDIVHCHNLHGEYFDLHALEWLSARVPVVITMHDAWLLSGHCVHSLGCGRWETGCGKCPDLTLYPAIRRDATAHNWKRKRSIYRSSRLHVATPCRWLMDKVERSILSEGASTMKVIPHGIDLKEFKPVPKSIARAQLGLPPDADVLLFAANGIRQNIWKDYVTMRAAVEMLSSRMTGRNIVFIALGDVGPSDHIGSAEIRFIVSTALRICTSTARARTRFRTSSSKRWRAGLPSSGRLSAAFPSRSRASAASAAKSIRSTRMAPTPRPGCWCLPANLRRWPSESEASCSTPSCVARSDATPSRTPGCASTCSAR